MQLRLEPARRAQRGHAWPAASANAGLDRPDPNRTVRGTRKCEKHPRMRNLPLSRLPPAHTHA
eukprot:6169752-Heterocapsa_arctica.AAC.1